jgi:MFS family permease
VTDSSWATEPTAPRLLTLRFALVVTSGLAYFMALGMLLPVVPQFIKNDLGGNDVAVGVGVGAFAVGAVLLRPFAGRIGDRVGRRVLIVAGAVIVGAAGLLYLFASGLVPLVAVRVVAGVGEAAFFVGAAAMITDLAPEARRGEAISYWSVAVYGGLAFGPLLGNVLLDRDHFDRVWLVSAGLAFLAAAIGLCTRETVAPDDRRQASQDPQPLISRPALAPGTVLFLGLIGLAGFTEFVPLYVDEIGMSDSSSVFLLYGCLILGVRIFGARVPDRIGPLRAGSIATSTAAAGLAVIAVWPSATGLYAGTVVFSIGMSFLYPAMLTLALTGLSDTERGSAVGTVSSFFDLSQGIGALLLGVVAAFAGYRGAFLAGGVLAIAALVLLRSSTDARTRAPVDHEAAARARESLEPDLP